jgi:hypothetical protein
LVDRDQDATNVSRVKVSPTNIVEVTCPHDADVTLTEMRNPRVEIIHLVDGHVAAVARTLLEQSASGGALLRRRHDLQKLVADHHERVVETELTHAGVVEAHRQTEIFAQLPHNGI